MTSFREFLEEQESRVRAEEERNREKVEQWTRCVAELMEQISRWLGEDDSRDLLKIVPRTVEVSEPTLGTYSAASLFIRLGSRVVDIVPISCRVMGPMTKPRKTNWLGRVDLIGSQTYHLYYGPDHPDRPGWFAVGEMSSVMHRFTREFFEVAMVELFS